MSSTPLISLILCVKNGMPYLPQAIESVRAQTFRDFELIVQDARSTDGSLEYLRSLCDLPAIEIVSEPDGGIGDAYNRAVRRCQGALIGTIDADNLLEPDALAKTAAQFQAHPDWAAFYGVSHMIDEHRKITSTWTPPEFELAGLRRCEVVPPFSVSFFARAVCGDELRFDETLKTCADFDLWLRLSHLPIHLVQDLFGSTRISEHSMSCRAATYEQFCQDKITALGRHLTRAGVGIDHEIYREAVGGIYAWAAESLLRIEGQSAEFERLFNLAESLAPSAKPLESVRQRISAKTEARDPTSDPAPKAAADLPTDAGPTNDSASSFEVLSQRIGRMLGRAEPVSEADLVAAMNTLNEIVTAEDPLAHIRDRIAQFPPATVPLIAQHLQAAWMEENHVLAEALETIYGRCTAHAA
ncbi:MAG: glycosyltransferase [Verrucomicrobia bacterium]|nr:glycosyltransferase [Verrucomicrobiota bacterium]